MILVGDSLGMCVYGYGSTVPVTMDQCIVHCDGQLLIISDLIGQFQAFTPRFVDNCCSIAETVIEALKAYREDVTRGEFPADDHCYHMVESEYEKLVGMLE
jgi:3-methyl-2-oxobutanoate hydroxymethyltransferase